LEKEVEDGFGNTMASEKDMIKQGYALDVFDIFGDDPYTIPITILTKAWMKTVKERDSIHL
jgi:hypothetical protein